MCTHNKPTRNDEERGYCEAYAPAVSEGDKIVYDECGRCAPQVNGKGSTDYHSHHFRVVKGEYGPYALLVRHGGGDERFSIGWDYTRVVELLAPMTSDARYLMLHALYNAHHEGREAEFVKWRAAAIQKRIKVNRRGRTVRVWIEQPQVAKVA